MEARAVGTIEASDAAAFTALLVALSGQTPAPITLHEMVLKGPVVGKNSPELILTRAWETSGGDGTETSSSGRNHPESWTTKQYNIPLWGDKNLSKLPATVRKIQFSPCTSPDPPSFFKALNFTLDYQLLKEGHLVDLHVIGGLTVHLMVSKLSRVHTQQPVGSDDVDAMAIDTPANGNTTTTTTTTTIPANNKAKESMPTPTSSSSTPSHHLERPVPGQEISPGYLLVEAWALTQDTGAHQEVVAAVTEVGALVAGHVQLQAMPPKAGNVPNRGRNVRAPGMS